MILNTNLLSQFRPGLRVAVVGFVAFGGALTWAAHVAPRSAPVEPASVVEVTSALQTRADAIPAFSTSGIAIGGPLTEAEAADLIALAAEVESGTVDRAVLRPFIEANAMSADSLATRLRLDWEGYRSWTLSRVAADPAALEARLDAVRATLAPGTILEVAAERTDVSSGDMRFSVSDGRSVRFLAPGLSHALDFVDSRLSNPTRYEPSAANADFIETDVSSRNGAFTLVQRDVRAPRVALRARVLANGMETSQVLESDGQVVRATYRIPHGGSDVPDLVLEVASIGSGLFHATLFEVETFDVHAAAVDVDHESWLPAYRHVEYPRSYDGSDPAIDIVVEAPVFLDGCASAEDCRDRAIDEVIARLGSDDPDVDFDGNGVVDPADAAWASNYVRHASSH